MNFIMVEKILQKKVLTEGDHPEDCRVFFYCQVFVVVRPWEGPGQAIQHVDRRWSGKKAAIRAKGRKEGRSLGGTAGLREGAEAEMEGRQEGGRNRGPHERKVFIGRKEGMSSGWNLPAGPLVFI